MQCPQCQLVQTKEHPEPTELGYRRFRCRRCDREFNERTGTPFNRLQYPRAVVGLVVLWRLRYELRLYNLAEMFLECGFVFTHETVRIWEATFAPLLADRLRTHRYGQGSRRWHIDEPVIKVDLADLTLEAPAPSSPVGSGHAHARRPPLLRRTLAGAGAAVGRAPIPEPGAKTPPPVVASAGPRC